MKKIIFVICIVLSILTVVAFLPSCALGVIEMENFKNEAKYSIGNFTYNADEIDKIEINWVSGNINLVESENETLSVSEKEDALKDNQKMRYLIEGRVLKIQFWKAKYRANVKSELKNLTIEIPKNIELKINQVSGNVKSESLTLKNLDVNIVSGNVVIGSLTSNDVHVDSVSGQVKIDSLEGKDVYVDSVSGNVLVGFSSAKKVIIDSTSGDVRLKLHGLGATIKFSSVSGRYGNNKTFGDGSCEINVSTTSGDLKVEE